MKLKDILYPLVLSMLFVWTINYFFPRQGTFVEYGQRVAVPQEVEIKPLNKEVDFVDAAASETVQTTQVETAYGKLLFSTAGASLQHVEYTRTVDGKSIELVTITPVSDVEKEQSFFLVALNEKTPYFYVLEDYKDDAQKAVLVYKARVSAATVEKTYTVYKNKYHIDLELHITPHDQDIQPRVFFASPLLVGMTKLEHTSGVMEEKKKVVKYSQSRYARALNDDFWQQPSLFGAEDRYFVHALVGDHNNFVRRGYYSVGVDHLRPILEGPAISQESSWKLSFYIGPKEQEPMAAVDPRLEATLDYGWFAPVAKSMLWLMKLINEYVHSFGLAIIIFTLLIRLLLAPFSWGMVRRAEQAEEYQKKMRYIKQKYKNNPEALAREQEALQQKQMSNIFGGCVVPLVQFPLFFGMNRVLSSSIELYKAPFLWIPDLSAKDPFYILPLLFAASILLTSVQAKEEQQRMMGIVGAVMVGIFMIGFSSGLVLFLFVSTLLGSIQTMVQKKLKI